MLAITIKMNVTQNQTNINFLVHKEINLIIRILKLIWQLNNTFV